MKTLEIVSSNIVRTLDFLLAQNPTFIVRLWTEVDPDKLRGVRSRYAFYTLGRSSHFVPPSESVSLGT